MTLHQALRVVHALRARVVDAEAARASIVAVLLGGAAPTCIICGVPHNPPIGFRVCDRCPDAITAEYPLRGPFHTLLNVLAPDANRSFVDPMAPAVLFACYLHGLRTGWLCHEAP